MSNNSRRSVRINAMKMLYNMDLMKNSIEEAKKTVFEDSDINEDSISLVLNVLDNKDKIEEIITKSLVDYSLNRLSYVDRAIVMIAVYEMMNGLIPAIAINEAIEITKEFSNLDDNKAKNFNNKLLDNIAKNLK